jgi:hypothetical protein
VNLQTREKDLIVLAGLTALLGLHLHSIGGIFFSQNNSTEKVAPAYT